jgi:hypothetical protein
MYVSKISGLMQYETFDEILNADIVEAYEGIDKYYFLIKSDDFYANTIWIIDKKTRNVSSMMLTQFMFVTMYEEEINKIDPKTIKIE